jgi:hypothetical protein
MPPVRRRSSSVPAAVTAVVGSDERTRAFFQQLHRAAAPDGNAAGPARMDSVFAYADVVVAAAKEDLYGANGVARRRASSNPRPIWGEF